MTDEKKKEEKELPPLMSWPPNFPYDEPAIPGMGGKIYQWIKNRYYKNRREWKKSDVIVWKGSCTVMLVWIGYLIFAGVFGWLFIKLYDTYGIGKMLAFFFILILWRVNIMIKQLAQLDKKFK
jgi:hypothetical protein